MIYFGGYLDITRDEIVEIWVYNEVIFCPDIKKPGIFGPGLPFLKLLVKQIYLSQRYTRRKTIDENIRMNPSLIMIAVFMAIPSRSRHAELIPQYMDEVRANLFIRNPVF